MKPLAYIFLGALAGLAGIVLSIYVFSMLVHASGVVLYRSEADQQRNFNVALLLTVGFTLVGGWVGYIVAKRKQHHAHRGDA